MHSKVWVTGLMAATYSPMDSIGGKAITTNIASYASFLQSQGVKWVFVNGTTGESQSLTVEERKSLAEAWTLIAPKYDIKVFIHVGHESINEAVNLAYHASNLTGVSGIAWMPQTFFKPASLEALVQTMKTVADHAPNLPIYYYHIPSMTGVNFQMIDFLKSADGVIKNLNGVKFTDTALMDFVECIQFKDHKYNMLFGRDEQMIAAQVLGADGFVGSTYNYMGDMFNQLLKEYRFGGTGIMEARKLQYRAANLVTSWGSLAKYSSNPQKLIMKLSGNDMGGPRLPSLNYTPELETDLKEKLKYFCKDATLPSWCAKFKNENSEVSM